MAALLAELLLSFNLSTALYNISAFNLTDLELINSFNAYNTHDLP